MISTTSLRRRAAPIDRSTDRLVVVSALGISLAFLFVAALSTLLPEATRHGVWLPLHLALAGGATVAVAGVMPFFAAAFAAAPPSPPALRVSAIVACTLGAIGVTSGVVTGLSSLAAIGGLTYISGVILIGAATVHPLTHALGPSRGIVIRGYVAALAMVAIGAGLATLFEAGWQPVSSAWGAVKPAHAWLNFIGFLSLVIATTLLHFFPTVVGGRIQVVRSARWTIWGLAVGAPLVALGLLLASDPIAWAGAAAVEVGALALAAYGLTVWRARGHWSTDRDWHRFAMLALVSAIVWFEVGIAIAVGRVVAEGASPASWDLDLVIGPLAVGWVGLAILASASHLVPAVGPGGQKAHARQRTVLGHLSVARLVAADSGVALLTIGLIWQLDGLVTVGAILVGLTLLVSGTLIIWATAAGMRRSPSAGQAS